MAKTTVNPPTLFNSLEFGFSQVVIASGSKTVFISGQTAWNANRQSVGTTLGEQSRQAFRNLQVAVEAAGGTMADIVALRIYIVHRDGQSLDGVGSALREAFPADPPASSWIGVASLAAPEFLIEVEATAVVD